MAETAFAIVGGGIVGASVAYHLGGRTDAPVTVYERDGLASETTFRSTAMIGVAGPDPYRRMKEYGFRLYNEFFADPAANPQYRRSGRLRVATSTEGAARLARLAAEDPDPDRSSSPDREPDGLDAAKFANSPVEFVPGGELLDRFLLPALDAEVVEGALYRPRYGHVRSDDRTLGPRELALEFVERARDRGVAFETGTEVTSVATEDGRVTGIEVDGTAVDADAVVLAAGPWNVQLAEDAGIELPVGHVLSPVFALELDRPLPCQLPAIKSHESSVGLHPKRDDTVLVTYTPDEGASRYDPSAVGDAARDDHRRIALRWAERLLPALGDAELVDEWVGVGTSTPDGKPVVGPTAVEGLSLAVTRAGIQYAPAVGSILARQLVEGDPTEYADAVSLSRFDGDD